jgi:hypothetical protein
MAKKKKKTTRKTSEDKSLTMVGEAIRIAVEADDSLSAWQTDGGVVLSSREAKVEVVVPNGEVESSGYTTANDLAVWFDRIISRTVFKQLSKASQIAGAATGGPAVARSAEAVVPPSAEIGAEDSCEESVDNSNSDSDNDE